MTSKTLRFVFNHPLGNDRERKGGGGGRAWEGGQWGFEEFEYLENEKNLLDEIKSIVRNYLSAIICSIKEK